ncbi:signal peptidase I [Haloplanus halophilus]|uniref:signal peptidase I n=1 Tax=Haloplanus halophilus TaxID=2949993 RepID=UPI00203DC31F|nr:signal peptidase I [Haloplanus sp. GDY1]
MSESDRDTVRFVANVLVVLLLIGAVTPFVVYAVPGVVGADHGLVVLSGSMEPRMSPGDAIIVREVPPGQIEQGDIITFQTSSETPTTHRVVEVRRTEDGAAYVTKGDANEERDPGVVPHDRVVGEVVFVIPLLGHVIQFANTQMGFLMLVLTPMLLFVLSELWELAKSIRQPEATATGTDAAGATPESVAAGAATPAAADDGADTDGGSFTLTRSSLQVLLLLLGFYVPYSAYVAYTTREAWSIGAATATIIGFLFCLVIYVASRGDAAGGTATGAVRSTEGVVRHGRLPARLDDRTTVPLDSVESLVQMAIDRDDWVIYDDDRDTYYMTRDDALYLHRASPETDGGAPVESATGASPDDERAADATNGGDVP